MAQSVCIIPARGGSRGIPGKNLQNVGGKPLVVWSIEQALGTAELNGHVYVTSDSAEILNAAERAGARPIRRPPEFASDTASSESAIKHALGEVRAKWLADIEYVVFLQPTSPLRKRDDIAQALTKIRGENADSLLSVQPLRDHFIWRNVGAGERLAGGETGVTPTNFDYKNRKRRQEIEVTYLENGSIYIFKPELLEQHNNRLGGKVVVHEMDRIHSVQIDERVDLELCDYYLRKLYS